MNNIATQAVISFVNARNETLIKVVAGCDGYNARKVADEIMEKNLTDINEIYKLSIGMNLGCGDCLVVMDKNSEVFHGKEELPKLYREKFGDPEFNPRWKWGTVDHLIVIDRESKKYLI